MERPQVIVRWNIYGLDLKSGFLGGNESQPYCNARTHPTPIYHNCKCIELQTTELSNDKCPAKVFHLCCCVVDPYSTPCGLMYDKNDRYTRELNTFGVIRCKADYHKCICKYDKYYNHCKALFHYCKCPQKQDSCKAIHHKCSCKETNGNWCCSDKHECTCNEAYVQQKVHKEYTKWTRLKK